MANKEGSFTIMWIVMGISFLIAISWNQIPELKNAIHALLDPTAGFLLNWNLTLGMLAVVFLISLLTILIQKYTTDQDALKELRKEQKILQEEMKKYKEHPDKLMELQKKQLEFIPRTMKLSTRSIAYTGVPIILFFRWFDDVFAVLGSPKFFGFLSWFWFYLISALVFQSILKKWFKVV